MKLIACAMITDKDICVIGVTARKIEEDMKNPEQETHVLLAKRRLTRRSEMVG